MKDEFVSTEHLLLAMTRTPSKANELLKLNGLDEKDLLQGLQAVRGSARVTDPNPEGKFQALRSTGSIWCRWPARTSSIRSLVATKNSSSHPSPFASYKKQSSFDW